MAIKKIHFYLPIVLLLICDPSNTKEFIIMNDTSIEMDISLHHGAEIDNIFLPANNSRTIYEFTSIGGDFGSISKFDSLVFEFKDSNRVSWLKPNNSYGYIDLDFNIGEIRENYKDVYNRSFWMFLSDNNKEQWIYSVKDEDFEFFE